jgi:hypothetical protein
MQPSLLERLFTTGGQTNAKSSQLLAWVRCIWRSELCRRSVGGTTSVCGMQIGCKGRQFHGDCSLSTQNFNQCRANLFCLSVYFEMCKRGVVPCSELRFFKREIARLRKRHEKIHKQFFTFGRPLALPCFIKMASACVEMITILIPRIPHLLIASLPNAIPIEGQIDRVERSNMFGGGFCASCRHQRLKNSGLPVCVFTSALNPLLSLNGKYWPCDGSSNEKPFVDPHLLHIHLRILQVVFRRDVNGGWL